MPQADLSNYLEVLNDAVERANGVLPGIKVYFPTTAREDIASLMG
jgi:hypothetical protein